MRNTLLNTPKERHAFIIGFCELLPPWPAHYKNNLPVPSPLKGEEHYYLAGRTLGFIFLLALIYLAIKALT